MRLFVVTILLLSAALPSGALSCARMEERYYFSCVKGACAAEFRSMPIESIGGMCARRNEVSDIPPQIAAYLGRLIVASQPTVPDGLYSLRFGFRWWQYQSSQSFEQFERNFLKDYVRDRDGRDLAFISIDEVADKLNRDTSRGWIALEPTGSSPQQMKREVLEESKGELIRGIGIVVACWASLFALLGVLAHSARSFYVRLTIDSSRAGAKRLVTPILVQIALLIAPAFAILISWMFGCWAILLLSPAVLVIWLVEIFWAVRHRRRMQA